MVRVYQESHFACVEGGEHLADGRDADLRLVEHVLFLPQKDIVRDGSVGVCLWVVVQANDIALGDPVDDTWGEEGEEADGSKENKLQSKALNSHTGFQENLGQEDEAGPAGAVGKGLYT